MIDKSIQEYIFTYNNPGGPENKSSLITPTDYKNGFNSALFSCNSSSKILAGLDSLVEF